MDVLKRNNVVIRGRGTESILFSHGYGCDQNMWRFVAPAFEDGYRTILFDHLGAGASDLAAYSYDRHASLEGYADDVIEIAEELGLKNAIFVGHSVSAMIGLLAARKVPKLFKAMVLIGPSPSYIDDGDYVGGFKESEIDELLESLDSNHMGWSMTMAPVIMGNPQRAELGEELAQSFCRTDPGIAKHFARTTFLSDMRDILPAVGVPCLILQCSSDVIAPVAVGEYVQSRIPDSKLVILNATGHCPNLSAPEETIAAIKAFL
ncbi:MAG: alpha/beta hydrolase [Verrucomicrobiota bacterium]